MYQIGNIYFITALAVIGGGLFGFDISSMSAIIGTQSYLCYFNQTDKDPATQKCGGPTAANQGGITAAMPGGSWLGALISGILTDRLGRKRAIQVACIIWVIGSILVCASQNVAMLVVGRLINGLCVGIASAQVPVYISELAPPSKRGRLVGAQQWAITWGILIMFYISYGTSFINGTASFRIPWGLQMIPAVILFFGLFFVPESPRWLARQGRWEETHAVLVLVHGKGDPNAPVVEHEMHEIKEMVAFEQANADVTYAELFKPNMIHRTTTGLFMQIWSQLTGMNVMMYYITYIFLMAGQSGQSANLLASSIQYVINVVMTIPALLWVDRWGRRPTLLIGAALMATWLFANAGIMATYGYHAGPGGLSGINSASWEVHGAAGTGLIACTYLFVASYAPTWGPVSWIYPPELYPMRVRGKAVAFATSGNWAFNAALGAFVPPAFENINWKVYIVFGVFCVAMWTHVFFLFPETAGKTLEEVSAIFEDPNGIKYIGTPAWKTHGSYRKARELETNGYAEENRVNRAAHQSSSSGDESSPDRGEKIDVTHSEVAPKVV